MASTTEKLIDLLRERQFLYDLAHKDYKNRQKIKAAWLEIATEMGTEDGNYWSSKWKVLKDNYTKHKKSNAVFSGQAYKKYKNWPWAELMRFLDDFNKSRPTESNINSNSQSQMGSTQENLNSSTQENLNSGTQENLNSGTQENLNSSTQENLNSGTQENLNSGTQENLNSGTQENLNSGTQENLNSGTQENLNSSTQENINSSRDELQGSSVSENRGSEIRKRKAKNNTEPTNTVLEYLRMKNEQKKCDEVDHFFLSYAQTFKKLPNRMQSMIKLDIATLFARYELQYEASGRSSNPQTAPPSVPGRYEFLSALQNSIPSPLPASSTEFEGQHSAVSSNSSTAVPQVLILPNATFQTETTNTPLTTISQDSATQNASNYYETMAYTLNNEFI